MATSSPSGRACNARMSEGPAASNAIYRRAAGPGVYLILDGASVDQVRERMGALPFVIEGLMTLDYEEIYEIEIGSIGLRNLAAGQCDLAVRPIRPQAASSRASTASCTEGAIPGSWWSMRPASPAPS
jgi:hypothetical protein